MRWRRLAGDGRTNRAMDCSDRLLNLCLCCELVGVSGRRRCGGRGVVGALDTNGV